MRRGRVTIGLYNSYDPKKFREAHRRALARAGPLALAYDANLATFGFPFPEELGQAAEVAAWVAASTSIGDDGGYLLELSGKGRFQCFPYPGKGFPPQLGETILTTSKPEPSMKMDVQELVAMLRTGQSVMLLFGLGPHGVPKKAASIARKNLDVTGGEYSLETCTALGAVMGAIGALLSVQ